MTIKITANKLIQRTFKSVAAFAKNAKPAPLLKAPDEGVSCPITIMEYFEYSQNKKDEEYFSAQNAVKEIYEFMCSDDISMEIAKTHQVNATSHQIQKIILPKCKKLGMSGEKNGLFSNHETAQLRPDYYLPINKTGLIMEVERGKTIANNMDLLDIWKCHICEVADYLLLVVPEYRQTNAGSRTNIYKHVVKRIGSFFMEGNNVNVKGCFIIGY